MAAGQRSFLKEKRKGSVVDVTAVSQTLLLSTLVILSSSSLKCDVNLSFKFLLHEALMCLTAGAEIETEAEIILIYAVLFCVALIWLKVQF